MPIDYSRLRSLTAREVISALARDGLVLDRPGETFEIKTLRTMIEIQAHWTEKDLERLKLIG